MSVPLVQWAPRAEKLGGGGEQSDKIMNIIGQKFTPLAPHHLASNLTIFSALSRAKRFPPLARPPMRLARHFELHQTRRVFVARLPLRLLALEHFVKRLPPTGPRLLVPVETGLHSADGGVHRAELFVLSSDCARPQHKQTI